MGRQIRFFLFGKDEEEFLDYIYSNGDSIADREGKLRSIDEVLAEKPFYNLYIKSAQSVILLKDYGLIDHDKSNVIEFARNRCTEPKKIQSGRLWVELIDYDEDGNKYRKEKWLEDKYNLYKRWIVKNGRISKDKFFYIGNTTFQLYKNGAYMMMHEPDRGVEFE